MRLLLAITLVSVAVGCATDKAAKIRAQKPVTVGYPAVEYRPHYAISVGLTGSSMGKKTVTLEDESKKTNDDQYKFKPTLTDRKVDTTKTGYSVSPYVRYFPFNTSAFYLGFQATMQKSRYQYTENTTPALAQGSTADVDYESTYTFIDVPVGWAWIWESGFSATLGLGPRFLIGKSARYNDDGGDQGVDVTQREKVTSELSKWDLSNQRVAPNLMVGYSF